MAHPDWRAVHDELSRRDSRTLTGAELDLLGESLFWLDRPDESIAVLGQAFKTHAADREHAKAAMAAWQLFFDHALVGEVALAQGWLERARRHCLEVEGSPAAGFVAVAESALAAEGQDFDDALRHADRAVEIGWATGDSNLLVMGLQAKGHALVGCGRTDEGIGAYDEAMAAVVNGELAPLFTGWVYCRALATCHDVGDLRRAAQWSEAATRWCDELPQGRLYPGICRLHVVELEILRGTWTTAAALAREACADLTAHDARYAGDAHYLIGELHRMSGDLDLAEEAYTNAHQLGRLPQPGLARVRMAQGRGEAAVNALRLALDASPSAPLRRAELLVALTEAQAGLGDLDAAEAMAREFAHLAGQLRSDYLDAVSLSLQASLLLARGEATPSCRCAGEAAARFRSLGLVYDEARAREVRGSAAGLVGDHDTAQLELQAALQTFRGLGAEPDGRRVAARLGEEPSTPLSSRETEVLRLVAGGRTNKEVAAELTVSEHTVARHLSNIYTKLGVGSRAAATASAYEHALI